MLPQNLRIEDIKHLLQAALGEAVVVEIVPNTTPPCLTVPVAELLRVCMWLRDSEHTYCDMLSCITGIDNGAEAATMEVWYHLYSIPYHLRFALRVVLPRTTDTLPSIPSVAHLWRTADWHEREIYDLLGIHFEGHPDLRRILLPADWEGYPLRKDYVAQVEYHGIRVAY